MASVVKLYEDKDLSFMIETLDLKVVPAGESKRFTFWVLNDSEANIKDLQFDILGENGSQHPEVEIIESPEELTPHAVGELIIEWSPSVTLKEGLKAQVEISGKELWG